MASEMSILEALADALPLDLELLFYHVSTPPTLSSALFSAPPGHTEEKTFCETHFLATTLPAKGDLKKELLVFAIEVLIFTTQTLTTIFISKADSTGYLHLHNTQPGVPSVIKTICSTVLSYLVRQRLDGPRLLLSLFARSQNQYLFPGSIENPGKHVLDDRQLIRWWCRALDPVLREYAPATVTPNLNCSSRTSSEAYIIVPGCDSFGVRAFFPPNTELDSTSRWSSSYPRDLIVPHGPASPRCLIPRFPDDPKARFLDDLDSEISGMEWSDNDGWRSVKSLDQFWEMMSYRQECSAGRLVGFIWVVFTPPHHGGASNEPGMYHYPDHAGQSGLAVSHLPTPTQSQMDCPQPVLPPSTSDDGTLELVTAASPPPSSPLLKPPDVPEKLPSGKNNETQSQECQGKQATPITHNDQKPNDLFYDDARTTPIRWPPASRGQFLLSEQNYQLLLDHLLQSDFADQDLAAQSTSSLIITASELSGISNWGQRVKGRKPVVTPMRSSGSESKAAVNMLTGIRKKRKLGSGASTTPAAATMNEAVSRPEAATLSTDHLSRKRKFHNTSS